MVHVFFIHLAGCVPVTDHCRLLCVAGPNQGFQQMCCELPAVSCRSRWLKKLQRNTNHHWSLVKNYNQNHGQNESKCSSWYFPLQTLPVLRGTTQMVQKVMFRVTGDKHAIVIWDGDSSTTCCNSSVDADDGGWEWAEVEDFQGSLPMPRFFAGLTSKLCISVCSHVCSKKSKHKLVNKLINTNYSQ